MPIYTMAYVPVIVLKGNEFSFFLLGKKIFFPNSAACTSQKLFCLDSLAYQVLIKYFFIFRVSKEYIGIVVFCIRDYTSRVRIHSIFMTLFENFGLHSLSCRTVLSSVDLLSWVLSWSVHETYLQFKMNKHFIKSREKKSHISSIMINNF